MLSTSLVVQFLTPTVAVASYLLFDKPSHTQKYLSSGTHCNCSSAAHFIDQRSLILLSLFKCHKFEEIKEQKHFNGKFGSMNKNYLAQCLNTILSAVITCVFVARNYCFWKVCGFNAAFVADDLQIVNSVRHLCNWLFFSQYSQVQWFIKKLHLRYALFVTPYFYIYWCTRVK